MLVPRSLLVVAGPILWAVSCLAIISSPGSLNGKGSKAAESISIFKAESKIGKLEPHDVTSRHATEEELKLPSQPVEYVRDESSVDSSGSYQHHFPAYSDVTFSGGEGGGYYQHGHSGHGHGHHFVHHHDHHHEDHKNVALKGLLVPLAGVALLGAAAALVSNPVLLQLGVITAGRRRRSTETASVISNPNYILPHEYLVKNLEAGESPKGARETINEEVQQQIQTVQVLERFMAEVPREQAVSEEKRLLAQYVSCAAHGEDACLERLTCELHGPQPPQAALDQRVMAIVTGEILENEWVSSVTKERIREAADAGKRGEDCARFRCSRVSESEPSRKN